MWPESIQEKIQLPINESKLGHLMIYLFLAFLFIWLTCGFFTASVAGDKNHNLFALFIAGLLFGPIGLIAAVGLSDRTQRRYVRLIAERQGVRFDRCEDEFLSEMERIKSWTWS